jgi:uncharacterized protein YuzB (UPF0349 family)
MGFILVEICDNNLMATIDLEGEFKDQPEVAVLRYECLNLCGLCAIRPYALVNGERVFAKTIEECLELIKIKVAEELEQYL